MKQFEGIINKSIPPFNIGNFSQEEILFFDIETTGFSPKNSILYCIGICYFQQNTWHYTIYFNENGKEEEQVMEAFCDMATHYKALLHFNGDTFDLPYIYQVLARYPRICHYTQHLKALWSFDLFKLMKKFKKGFSLPNLKLKTLERAIGIHRQDTYTGGELISIYQQYCLSPSLELEQLLFQHNHDDIVGMLDLICLFNYQKIIQCQYTYSTMEITDTQCIFYYTCDAVLPILYSIETEGYHLSIDQQELKLSIPLHQGIFHYYLADWKNYYYLPLEDTIVHKSIGQYMDKEYRTPATKAQCFLKKEGLFIPLPLSIPTEKIYRRHLKDPLCFYEFKENLFLCGELPKELLDYIVQLLF